MNKQWINEYPKAFDPLLYHQSAHEDCPHLKHELPASEAWDEHT